MKLRLRLVAVFLGPALSVIACIASGAQTFPDKPIRWISPFPPGGGNDILSRSIAQKLSEQLGQQVVVDNRAGANNVIGTDIVARAAADGYTLILASSNHVINPSLYHSIPYDAIRDFTPVILVGLTPLMLVVHPGVAASSVGELINLAKSRPGQLNFASTGGGGVPHLAGVLFNSMAGVDIKHIPYKGSAQAVTDVLGGQVQLMYGTMLAVLQQVRAGKLRGLGVTSAQRSPAAPDIPTIAEAGVPGYAASLWYGVLAPAATRKDIVFRLNAEIAKALHAPEVKERIVSQGVDLQAGTPDEFALLIGAELQKWPKVIKDFGVRVD